ncbi:MAG: phenylalanine--tRNA ligase subunit beta [Eubacteriaceae bacterium]
MLVSLKWLKEYVNITEEPYDFGEALTMSGTKVETLEVVSDKISKILTGKIIKIEKHPNADKLVICQLDLGSEIRTIITGATNVYEGAIVPVAIDGAVIANGTTLGVTEFRGIPSYGMLCSVEELGMNCDLFSNEILDGIYILPDETPLGMDIKEYLWLDDVIIDIELTANRSDCQSIVGIARESAATLDLPMREYQCYLKTENKNEIADFLTVKIESDLCHRYTAKMLKINKIEASPLWMQLKLMNSGVRPINNIVDVTNYVMLELGQPLHAFDYHRLNTNEIIVKTTSNTSFVTLDGKERKIDDSMLMITNGIEPVAIAGIMGGENSEIATDSKLIVLESACFNKNSVRLTAKKLGLRTEASGRFEKGIDPELALAAILRATHLLIEIDACEVVEGLIDCYPNPVEIKTIVLNTQWVNRFIGINLSDLEMSKLLERLEFKTELKENGILEVTVPSFRQDIEIMEDLAEEIARIFGYNNIPSTIMSGHTMIGGKKPAQKFEDKIKRLLVGQGVYEVLTSSFTSDKKLEALNIEINDQSIELINPLGEENSRMRHSLISHQLEVVSLNYNRKNPYGHFFEIANTYKRNSNASLLPHQEKNLVISAYGNDVDYFHMKGLVELILKNAGINYPKFVAGGPNLFHPGRKALIYANNQLLGEIGEIHPVVVKNYDLPKRTYVCELSFSGLFEFSSEKDLKFVELPKFPSSNRDLAIVVKNEIPSINVEEIIRIQAGELLENIELFDVYTGEQINEGFKSLGYALNFRDASKTLTDDDINPVIERILNEIKDKLDGRLRA